MDKQAAQRLARGITTGTGTGDAATRLTARAHPLAADIDERSGWAVAVTTPSRRQILVVNAGGYIRDLEAVERKWATIAGFAAWAEGAPVEQPQGRGGKA